MKRESIVLRIMPKDGFDFQSIVIDIANGKPVKLDKCEIDVITHPVLTFRDDIADYVAEHGLSTLLSIEPLMEDVTTPKDSTPAIQKLLIRFMTSLNLKDELIIVDPYFYYPNADDSYANMILNILDQFINDIREIRVITAPNKRAYSTTTRSKVERAIKDVKPDILITHSTSDHIHDRFWITSNRQKGILLGTSLNGLGKKYSVIEYLSPQDVVKIVSVLKEDNLL